MWQKIPEIRKKSAILGAIGAAVGGGIGGYLDAVSSSNMYAGIGAGLGVIIGGICGMLFGRKVALKSFVVAEKTASLVLGLVALLFCLTSIVFFFVDQSSIFILSALLFGGVGLYLMWKHRDQ
jgi:ABC-type uncharacterized transport system permease subunit